MTPLDALRRDLRAMADPKRAAGASRFFKTGPGDYGEGDRFLGVSVPQTRSLAVATDDLREVNLLELLRSDWHEERLLALFVLVRRFVKSKHNPLRQKEIVDLFLANTQWINNWDLVDSSAPQILGSWLLDRDRRILKQLAKSPSLWEQRIAILATFAFIRAGDFSDTLALSKCFLTHQHDLIHKACGWMLREVGKRDISTLQEFLDAHAPKMPRTMLRYAIEKLPQHEREHYLSLPAPARSRR